MRLASFINNRDNYDGETMRLTLVSYSSEKYSPIIKNNDFFQHRGYTYKILKDYVARATFGTFKVTCSYVNEIVVV